MNERQRFVEEHLRGVHSFAELCRRFGISRKTGYKWVDRFLSGMELEDRSRRPHSSPRAVAEWLEDAIVRARKQRPHWGPKKLLAALQRANPDAELPAASTFALIFSRNGLVRPRRRRRKTPPYSAPFGAVQAANQVWCIDFKGPFSVGQSRCYPLTVIDAYSRYLIACVALRKPTEVLVRRALEGVFDEFGLPEAMRSDNGTPFASSGVGALSHLSAWWLRLGIRHERIEPGKPAQNGRLERFHLTLKRETASPPCATMHGQQRIFDRFRKEYNDERPHEALRNKVPSNLYTTSTRRLPDPIWGHDFEYPEHFETIQVSRLGYMSWNRRSVFLSTALRHQLVGLEWSGDNGIWNVFYGPIQLGQLKRGIKSKAQMRLKFIRAETVSPMSLE